MEENGAKVSALGILNTGSNYIIYIDGTSLSPLQLWHKENIYCSLFSDLPFLLCQSKVL